MFLKFSPTSNAHIEYQTQLKFECVISQMHMKVKSSTTKTRRVEKQGEGGDRYENKNYGVIDSR